MKARIILLFSGLYLFLPLPEVRALPITFEDFEWGTTLGRLELSAAEKGFRLVKKVDQKGKAELTYRAAVMGKEGEVIFSFTPLGRKLYQVRVNWEGPAFGDIVHRKLAASYKTPREEMPRLKIYIWTRKNTEVELRRDSGNTLLIYSDLHLWNDYREEKKRLEERAK